MATQNDEFNPAQPQRQTPDWTSASRGSQAKPANAGTLAQTVENEGKGRLFENLGRLFSTATQTADDLIKLDIEETVGDQANAVREEQTYNRSLEATRLNPNTPQEIRDTLNKSERLTAAREAGKLGDSHYWAQMDILARQLRSRYPGHRDAIDSSFSQITGNIPANAIRSALQTEINAYTEAGDSDQEYIDWAIKNKAGLVPADVPKIMEEGSMDTPTLRKYIQTEVLSKERKIAELNHRKAEFEDSKAANENVNQRGYELAKTELNTVLTAKLQDPTNLLGRRWSEFQTNVRDQFSRSIKTDTAFTADELVVLEKQWGQFDLAFNDEMNSVLGQYNDVLDKTQLEDLRTQMSSFTTSYKEALFNKDTGILSWKKTYLENLKNDTMSKLMQNQVFRTFYGAKEGLGSEGINAMLMRDPTILSPYMQLVKDLLKMAPHDPNSPPVGKLLGDTSSEINDPKVWTGATAEWQHTLTNLDTYTPTQQAVIVDKLFGPGNEDTIKMMDVNTRTKFFSALVNEDTVNKVLSSSDPEVVKKFTNWTMKSFTDGMTDEMAAVKEIVINRRYQTVSYDPSTVQFSIVSYEPKPGELPEPTILGATVEMFKKEPEARAAVDRINSYLRSLKSLSDAQGSDLNAEMLTILDQFGVDPASGGPNVRNKEGPYIDNLGAALHSATRSVLTVTGLADTLGKAGTAAAPYVASGAKAAGDFISQTPGGKALNYLTDIIGGYIGEAEGASRPFEVPSRTDLGGRGGPRIDTRSATAEPGVTGFHGFIAAAEGVAEGTQGYSQTFGNKQTGSHIPVQEMTLGQVLEAQDFMVSQGSQSSAIGRYQIINKTLKGLIKSMGLSEDAVFTPELQDRMAFELMKARGLDKFKAGEMTARQFATNLSKEWASLPNPQTGRTYYDDGLNRARVSTEDFLWSVEGLRAFPESGGRGKESRVLYDTEHAEKLFNGINKVGGEKGAKLLEKLFLEGRESSNVVDLTDDSLSNQFAMWVSGLWESMSSEVETEIDTGPWMEAVRLAAERIQARSGSRRTTTIPKSR